MNKHSPRQIYALINPAENTQIHIDNAIADGLNVIMRCYLEDL